MSGTLIGQELEPSLLVDSDIHAPRDAEAHPTQHAPQQQFSGKMEYNYLQRVKVYRLNDDGKWDDKGTGHVSVEYLERSDAIGLVVIDEDDNATLLVHRISTDDIYQRQEDTIISWTDPEVATDLALSFQESMGCAYIWDQICNVQRQIQLPSVLATEIAKDSSELPAVEMRTLPAIVKLVTDVSPFHRDRMASLILREGYVPRLLALFRACEEAQDTAALHHLYHVFKGLVLLNDSQLFDLLFAHDAILDVIGALEYDPDLPCRQQHRQFVQQQVVYREAIPIPDANLQSKIHQTYRLGYIKDVILPRALDDQTFSSINSLILFNNVEVVSSLQGNKPFLADLFARLRSTDPHSLQFTDLVRFLQEFCALHKHLQLAQRTSFFSALIGLGLFEVCTLVMQHAHQSVRLSGIDILMSLMVPDPAPLRTFLVEQPNHALLSSLVRGMVACREAEGGLHAQLLEMLRMLLDTDTMDAADKSKFLDLFYEDYLQLLISAVVAGTNASQPSTRPSAAHDSTGFTKKRGVALGRAGGEGSGREGGEAGRGTGGRGGDAETAESDGPEGGGAKGSGEQGDADGEERRGCEGDGSGGGGGQVSPSPDVLTSICDLLCFCVQHHSFRMKYYVLRNNVVEKVLRLTHRHEKYLSVAAIRFLRTCVGLKDDFYVRYLVKNRLLDPVMAAFRANGARYNLLNSVVLELMDFVRKENVRPLVAYIVESYGSWLDGIDYVDSFKLLRLKYEQNLEPNRPAVPPPVVIIPPSASSHHHHSHHHHHHHQQEQQQQLHHPHASPPSSSHLASAADASLAAVSHDNDSANDAATDSQAHTNAHTDAARDSDAADAADGDDGDDGARDDADDGDDNEEEGGRDDDDSDSDAEANDADANDVAHNRPDQQFQQPLQPSRDQMRPSLAGSAAGSALGVVPVLAGEWDGGGDGGRGEEVGGGRGRGRGRGRRRGRRHEGEAEGGVVEIGYSSCFGRDGSDDDDEPETAAATVPRAHSPPLLPSHPLPPLHLPAPLLHPPRLPPHQSLSPTARRPFSRSPSPPLGRPSLSPPARPLSPSARLALSRSPSPPRPLPTLPPVNGTICNDALRKRAQGLLDPSAAQAAGGAGVRGERSGEPAVEGAGRAGGAGGRGEGGGGGGAGEGETRERGNEVGNGPTETEGGEEGMFRGEGMSCNPSSPSPSPSLARKRKSVERGLAGEGDGAEAGACRGRKQLCVVVGGGEGGGDEEEGGRDNAVGGPRSGSDSQGARPKTTSPKSSSPELKATKPGSPKGGSPTDGSPKASSPKSGSPKGDSPKGGSPKGGSPKGGSPKRVGSGGDAGRRAMGMRRRFLQVHTQEKSTEALLGEVAPGGGAPIGKLGAMGRGEPTLGVCSPRPVTESRWGGVRGKGRGRGGGGEGDEEDEDDEEWAARLARAEEEEARMEARGRDGGDGGEGSDKTGGGVEGAREEGRVEGECAGGEAEGGCATADVAGKGGENNDDDDDDGERGAATGGDERRDEQQAHGENADSSAAVRAAGATGAGAVGAGATAVAEGAAVEAFRVR
ncbi:hypothetical protein CLOM_g13437 [Closterium sp. NIES-68]|nr:hypothetical protein CLOM_g13437 [Closterium sp. NIES-68]GJP72452.1 hypothetical protein CLOP_g3184 [Closterium sp. NIES-67]